MQRETRNTPRLCLSASRSPTAEIDREIETAGQAGFTRLELWAPAFEAYLARRPTIWLDMQMRAHGIRSLIVNGLAPPSEDRGEDALLFQARFLELCSHLDALGGGTVVLHPLAKQAGDQPEGNVRALRACADLAAPFEVILAFEYQAQSSTPDLDTAREIVERAARSSLRLAISTREWFASGTDPRKIEGVEPGSLALVHLDLPAEPAPQASPHGTQTPAGSEPGRLSDLCARLAAAGFRGPYCVPLPSGPGTLLERTHAARQAALDRLVPLYTKQPAS